MEAEMELAAESSPYVSLEETRTAMEEIAAKILFLKKEGKSKSELRELVTQMSLLFINLRQINRNILIEEDRIKAETESAKAPVDFTTLQLHNLMYEKNHYLKAIKACRDFRSKHPDIELVPEEEYFQSAPDDIKEKVLATDAEHDLMLKRLNFELFQRKELCKLHAKLEEHKRSLVDTIANRKKFLSSLPSHLKSLKKASLPLQQQLGILHTKKLKQHHAAELLPPPLFIVYSQLLAQKDAFEEKIEMEITGSVKDAQAYARQQITKENGVGAYAENNRLEDDAPDEEEDVQRRRKRPKKNLLKDIGAQEGIYQSHPLKVIVHIFDDEDPQAKPLKLISLRFEYLVKLNIVCVGVDDAEQAPDENILCNLFPNDTGKELPHQTAKLYVGDAIAFGDKTGSRPYMWAQHLAGIDFLPEVPPQQACNEVLNGEEVRGANVSSGLALYRQQNRVLTVLQMIRSRKKAQMALVEQLNSLVKLKWPSLEYENVPWALHIPVCSLQHWSLVGPIADSSLSVITPEKIVDLVDHELDRRSVTPWEIESTREDGELPMALPATAVADDSKKSSSLSPDLDRSTNLTLISKNMAPPKLVKSLSLIRQEDDLDLILDIESDMELCIEPETEIADVIEKPWLDHAAREFHLVLNRKDGSDQTLKLEAKVKISVEYPLRPPLFTLKFPPDGSQDNIEWYNELRSMESEVNLHILKILPVEHENFILAHQIRCLALLFDLHFNTRYHKTDGSVGDTALCKQPCATLPARSIRGRDRRRMLSWKGMV
ncbi:hypothetical protein AXF42_Ash013056 [Apostasia shenzhenica]|uniref:THO complex subunit 5B n=1 Tax=Apostasia shenzhenica TaxID=1088818 RepID=A0A2I0BCX3_9ASPA|nr:hypothetical protein AXF42_Ash013056 [Apostasia shenzhenica]